MSMQKKNVFQEFLKDDYTPTKDQQIVKYLQGRGNNLHSVEDYQGIEFLVSMPKKYRKTVWLQKGNCLVIDPVLEGNKVKGEIVCVIPETCVLELINSGKWPPEQQGTNISGGDNIGEGNFRKIKDDYLKFFQKDMKATRDSSPLPSYSDSSDSEGSEQLSEDEESDEEGLETDKKEIQQKSEVHIQVDTKNGSSIKNDYITLMSSSTVTVTTGELPEQTECESFEFGAECDSSDDTHNGTDVSRLVNAIRIRVSYPNPQRETNANSVSLIN